VRTWFDWLRCFVVVPTIAARTLPTVSAFIIRSGSFDLVIGQLSAYTFFYKELEGEEILSTGTGTIALDPTFVSFLLLKPVSH